MRYRKLDASGDYSFGHQQADFYRDQPEAVAQAVATGLRLFLGEWMLDTSAGMPWRTAVLGKYTASVHDVVIKDQILNTEGVKTLDSYASSVDPNTRRLTVQAAITTIYGPASISETL